jgi:glycosyltransferase involved in cell wall biosynthesis
MLGDGPLASALRARAAAAGIADRVTWHGVVPDAGRLLSAFEVFVLSSRTEGTPIVLFEAMAAEVPVVATVVGGVPDVVSGTEALLVPPDDPAALAAAVSAVLRDPASARHRALAAGRRLAEEYNVGPWLERYESLYHTLAAARRRAGALA